MRKPMKSKQLITILLSTIFLIGVAVYIIAPHGEKLKASNEDSFMHVHVENKDITQGNFETTQDQLSIKMTSKEAGIYKIPFDETKNKIEYIVNDKLKDIPYYAMSAEEFKLEKELSKFENSKSTDSSSDFINTEETQSSEKESLQSKIVRVTDEKNDSKGNLYFIVDKDETVILKCQNIAGEKQEIIISKADEPKKSQILFSFLEKSKTNTSTEKVSEKVTTKSSSSEKSTASEKTTETESTNSSEATKDTKEAKVKTANSKTSKELPKVNYLSESRASSPIVFSGIDLGVSTGTADFDSNNNPGNDTSATNNRVRSYDSVMYPVTFSVQPSNSAETYTDIQYSLEIKLPNAWTKDSNGKIRQTAEIADGNLVDNGDGTKSSERLFAGSISTSGQLSLTPVINVYSAINGEKLKPTFKLTIVSAKNSAGQTVEINNTVDSSTVSNLDTPITYVSSKPNIVANFGTTARVSDFNKVTGEATTVNSFVKAMGVYLSIKPLDGRAASDFRGATFPDGEVSYEITQTAKLIDNETKKSTALTIGKDTDPVRTMIYEGLQASTMKAPNFTSEYQKYSSSYSQPSLQSITIPYGYGNNIIKTPPTTNSTKQKAGVYDTGNPVVKNTTTNTISVKTEDYTPIGSDYYHDWGGKALNSNLKPFSVVAMNVEFSYDYIAKLYNKTLSYDLTIKKINWKDTVFDSTAKMVLSTNEREDKLFSYINFHDVNKVPLGSTSHDYKSNGDASITKGSKLRIYPIGSMVDMKADRTVLYSRWNANSLEFDDTYIPEEFAVTGGKLTKVSYGVGPDFPDSSIRSKTGLDAAYKWYSSISEAKAKGKISAIRTEYDITAVDGYVIPKYFIKVNAIGPYGAKDASGNPNIALSNTFSLIGNKISRQYPKDDGDKNSNYKATEYNAAGEITSAESPSQAWGDTLYISPIQIRTTIKPGKATYLSTEKVSWKLTANVTSDSDQTHLVKMTAKIPKGLEYRQGSATDRSGNDLPEPIIVENGDGSSSLTWVLDYNVADKGNPEVNFDTLINSWDLEFDAKEAVTVKASNVGELTLKEDSSVYDNSAESLRTSENNVNITRVRQMTINKKVDKSLIESGNEKDPAFPTVANPTDFTFTVTSVNDGLTAMKNVRILDILPYNGDGRGTAFTGSYSTIRASIKAGDGDLWYTNNAVPSDTDPNSIVLSTGWYKVTSTSNLKNAKALLALYENVEPGEKLQFELTMRPSGQKPGDIYANQTSFNSVLSQKVDGELVKVRVASRDLAGVAWYDDNLDGLIGNKKDGAPENFAANIPVKLYRTSSANSDYKNTLVKESLTGEKFIDDSGDSLIKTNTNGKYLFENLPEGNYIAEFDIGTQVIQKKVKVTEPLVGDDPTINSKAAKDDYKTPSYSTPLINDLRPHLTASDATYHVKNVNVGLIRESRVRLFKFETGSAVDADKNGQLSDAEKATGTPLANATFDIYKGDMEEKIATASTDSSGNLQFDQLYAGTYTLVETKAPSGYELIKNPITVTITEGNQDIVVYQDDNKITDLPFTGGNGPLLAILLTASGAMILGFGYVLWYYRTPKKKGVR